MSAYLISNIEVTDPALYEEYRKLVPATLEKYGGKFLVRGGPLEVLEGDWRPTRLVVLQFESIEQLKKWYSSDEYTPAKEIRWKASLGQIVIVEGV